MLFIIPAYILILALLFPLILYKMCSGFPQLRILENKHITPWCFGSLDKRRLNFFFNTLYGIAVASSSRH